MWAYKLVGGEEEGEEWACDALDLTGGRLVSYYVNIFKKEINNIKFARAYVRAIYMSYTLPYYSEFLIYIDITEVIKIHIYVPL